MSDHAQCILRAEFRHGAYVVDIIDLPEYDDCAHSTSTLEDGIIYCRECNFTARVSSSSWLARPFTAYTRDAANLARVEQLVLKD